MMADDLGSQPCRLSKSTGRPPYEITDDGFLLGVCVGFIIPPTIFVYQMLKARRQSRHLDLSHTYRTCGNLRRPRICTAPVGLFRATFEKSQLTLLKRGRSAWRWIRRAGGRFQVGTSLVAPGKWLSPLSSILFQDMQEAWMRNLVRPPIGVTRSQKKRTCSDMRRPTSSLHDTDSCIDETGLKRIPFEESMGAYWYRETLKGTVRTLRSPSGPFSRQSMPSSPTKLDNNPSQCQDGHHRL